MEIQDFHYLLVMSLSDMINWTSTKFSKIFAFSTLYLFAAWSSFPQLGVGYPELLLSGCNLEIQHFYHPFIISSSDMIIRIPMNFSMLHDIIGYGISSFILHLFAGWSFAQLGIGFKRFSISPIA